MRDEFNYPLVIFAGSFVLLWLSAHVGFSLLRRWRPMEEASREDFGIVLAATLTLLALIIGFSFSMATSRYEHRKNYEEAEAMRSAPSLPGLGCCLPATRQKCGHSSRSTSMSASFSTWRA